MPTTTAKPLSKHPVKTSTKESGGRPRATANSSARRTEGKTGAPKAGHSEKIEVVRGIGNVFADLGLPEPEVYQAKAELVRLIRQIVKTRELSQRAAAKVSGLSESDMSELMTGKLNRFSRERIENVLQAFDYDIVIHVVERSPEPERTRVIFEGSFEHALETA